MEANSESTVEDRRHERVGRLLDEVLALRACGDADGERALLAANAELAPSIRRNLVLVEELRSDDGGLDGLVSAGVLKPCGDDRYPAQLGAYKVRRLLGRGGMGIVLEAYEESLNRSVALKLLRPELAGEASSRRRFATEAQAAAATEHPNVVTVYAVGEESGVPFLAMEYVPGGSLADFLATAGPLPAEEVWRIFAEALAGLAAAHGCGLLHRDIKPSNILLAGNERRVKLADFGLARLLATPATQTLTGSILGTPEYMSPEQARGDRDIDQRSDLYSMGVVLYEMVTGGSPFRADTPAAVLHRILHEEPPDLRRAETGVDPLLAQIAARLLAKRRVDRFASASAVLDALRAGCPVVVPHRRRRIVRGALAATAIAIILAAVLMGGLQWLRPRPIVAVSVSKDRQRLLVLREGMSEPKPADWLPKEISAALVNSAALARGVDGESPLVVVGTDAPFDDAGSTLAAFRDDAQVWCRDLTRLGTSRKWRDVAEDTPQWHVRHILSYRHPALGRRLIVNACHRSEYPTAFVCVDPRDGNADRVFWHAGFIDGMMLADRYFRDGRPALLAWGVNNKLDAFNAPQDGDPDPRTKFDQVPVVMILDPVRLGGSGPPYGRPEAQAPPAGLLAYAFLDLSSNRAWRDEDGGLYAEAVQTHDCARWGGVRIDVAPRAADDDDGWRLRIGVQRRLPGSSGGIGRVALLLDRHLRIRRPQQDIIIEDPEQHYRDPNDWATRWHVLVPES